MAEQLPLEALEAALDKRVAELRHGHTGGQWVSGRIDGLMEARIMVIDALAAIEAARA